MSSLFVVRKPEDAERRRNELLDRLEHLRTSKLRLTLELSVALEQERKIEQELFAIEQRMSDEMA